MPLILVITFCITFDISIIMASTDNDQQLSQVVNFMLEHTVRQMKQYSQAEMDKARMDVTVEQWVILKIIYQEKELTQVDLAGISLKDTASITRMIDILEKKELVIRNKDAADRRKYLITLTKKGNAFVIKHMPLVIKLRQQTI